MRASGNYAPNFAYYAIPNFPKESLIIILFNHLIVYSITNNTMHKCSNVKLQLQVVYNNAHVMLYKLSIIKFQQALFGKI